MRLRKRLVSWLAFLAMLCYGFAPAYASLLAPPTPPISCQAQEAHTCACRLEAHSAKECCCGRQGGDTQCRVNRLPCDDSPVPAAASGDCSFPISAPASGPSAPRPTWRSARFPRSSAALRPGTTDLATPPPQRLSIA